MLAGPLKISERLVDTLYSEENIPKLGFRTTGLNSFSGRLQT